MIITRTPFRVSFFGGGTDIPDWFTHEGGQVLSTTIDKYCYVTARPLPAYFDHSIRLAYSRIETVSKPSEIRHPLLRAVFEGDDVNNIEIHHDSDLPSNSGLGTSSSFGVGLVCALEGLAGKLVSREELARRAIHYERHVLQEPGGFQDQIAAAFGGFNRITFHKNGGWSVHPLPFPKPRMDALQARLQLCYIPIRRFSGEHSIARDFDRKEHEAKLRFLHRSVDQAVDILAGGDLDDFGRLLHESWLRKREMVAGGGSNPVIDGIYERALAAGALGGKLLGAGHSGFVLLFCPEGQSEAIRQELGELLFVPFRFESEGSRIIYYQNRHRVFG